MLKKIRAIGNKKAVKICGWASLPLFAFFCLFILDYFNFYHYAGLSSVVDFVKNHPGPFAFEVILILGIMAVLLLLCRKAWIAGGVLGFFSLLFSFINYLKIALNGDNFYPQDITMVGDAGEIASFITVPLPLWFYIAAVFAVLWVSAYAAFNVEIPLKWKFRIPAAALLVIIALIAFTPANAENVIGAFGMSYVDTILQSSNYRANGFLGAFTLNILKMQVQEPEGYSENSIDEIIGEYDASPKTGEEDFDVIVVLSEAFFDVRELPGVVFSENPLTEYDELIRRENCYSGKLYSTALGGGTVRPEFEMLTGLSTDYMISGSSPWEYVTRDMESYVSEYRDSGYRTIAIHPYDKKFYSRSQAYEYVGFQEFYGQDELSQQFQLQYKRGYVTDSSTLEAMEYYLDNSQEPTFMFTITMQNHQAYNPIDENDIVVQVSCASLEDSVLDSLTTYTQGLYDADKMLGELVDYIDQRERPTILVFFGDHLPTLGSNYAAYNQTGYVDSSDGFSREEALKMYSTPFVIYSNRDIEIEIFQDNTGNSISPYNMLNAVSQATGFGRTEYMELLLDFYNTAPIYNVRLNLDVTPEIQSFLRKIELITYDRTSGKGYSE